MAIEPSLKHMHARTHKKITHKGDNAYSRDHWPRPHTIRAAQMHTHRRGERMFVGGCAQSWVEKPLYGMVPH